MSCACHTDRWCWSCCFCSGTWQLPPDRTHTAEWHWLQPGAGIWRVSQDFFICGSRELKFRSAGDKHVEPSSCRFLLDRREGKGIRGIIIKRTLQWEGRCCHIPFIATFLLLLMCFIASTDQSYPDKGWSRQTLSQTSSVWCCYSHACVADSCLHRKAFYQRIFGKFELAFPCYFREKEN